MSQGLPRLMLSDPTEGRDPRCFWEERMEEVGTLIAYPLHSATYHPPTTPLLGLCWGVCSGTLSFHQPLSCLQKQGCMPESLCSPGTTEVCQEGESWGCFTPCSKLEEMPSILGMGGSAKPVWSPADREEVPGAPALPRDLNCPV